MGLEDGQRILTRADLPTPPEPSTTSLYSRIAGSIHRTAQQSALEKQGGEKKKKRGADRKGMKIGRGEVTKTATKKSAQSDCINREK